MVLFVVAFVYFVIVSQFRLPHLRVFVYALKPQAFWTAIWSVAKSYILIIFGAVCTFCVIMYFIWLIIKKFVPNFPIPFKTILLKIPPLPQLERAGIFALIHGIFSAIFGRGNLMKRLTKVGATFANFIVRNTGMLMSAARGATSKVNFYPSKVNVASDREERKRRNKKRRPETGGFNSSPREVDDEYQQCIEENTIPATPDMTPKEVQQINNKNSRSAVTCKMRTLQTQMRLLTGQL